MRILTFNVNGIKSIQKKRKTGEKDCALPENCLSTLIREQSPDILCLQEIRCQDTKELDAYKSTHPYLFTNHSTVKKGYAGTAILSSIKPLHTWIDFTRNPECVPVEKREDPLFHEGRMLTAEFESFFIVCVYTPNSKDHLARLQDRLFWDSCFRTYHKILETSKPIVSCGDFNCAKDDIDIYNPTGHHKVAGFSNEERDSFKQLLNDCNLVDSFRLLHRDDIKYSYWSNFAQSRSKNKGWRIDYILVSKNLQEKIVAANILNEYFGSDHCPVLTEISL